VSALDDASQRQDRAPRSRLVRLAVGLAAGVILLFVTLRLRSAAGATRSVAATVQSSNVAWVVVAFALEAVSYVAPSLVLAFLLRSEQITRLTAARVTMTALGVGGLLPGQPLPGGALGYRELRERGVAARTAAFSLTVMIVAVPASSMLVLAAPMLVASGMLAPLPAGWRAATITAGVTATMLVAVSAFVLSGRTVTGARAVRGMVGLLVATGRRAIAPLVALGLVAWTADAACLWATSRALGVALPASAFPVAYIVGAVIIAVPILPGGLGGVEAAMPLVFTAAGASYADAALVVVCWRIVSFWTPTVAGLAAWASLVVERRIARRRAPQLPGAG
jgi:putative heme transporter